MRNYIKAELFRNFNRIYFWGYTGGIAALTLLVNILLSDNSINLVMLMKLSTNMLTIPIFLIGPIVDMVTAEEYKNSTFKNVLSFGISKEKLVLSKIIVSIILSLVAAIIILTVFFGSGTIIFGIGKEFSATLLISFIKILLISSILWIGSIAVCTFFAFSFKNSNIFSFTYVLTFVLFSKVITLLSVLVSDKFKYIHDILITTHINRLNAPNLTSSTLGLSALTGIMYLVVFSILTMLCIKNKEIN